MLAAGCGGLDIPFPELGTPKATPLTWVSRSIAELNTGPGIASLIGYYAIPMRVFFPHRSANRNRAMPCKPKSRLELGVAWRREC